MQNIEDINYRSILASVWFSLKVTGLSWPSVQGVLVMRGRWPWSKDESKVIYRMISFHLQALVSQNIPCPYCMLSSAFSTENSISYSSNLPSLHRGVPGLLSHAGKAYGNGIQPIQSLLITPSHASKKPWRKALFFQGWNWLGELNENWRDQDLQGFHNLR